MSAPRGIARFIPTRVCRDLMQRAPAGPLRRPRGFVPACELRYAAAMQWRLLIGLLGAALAGAGQGAEPSRTCINPDAMAKFTLDCAKNTSNSLTACYETAARIYCKVDPVAPPPQVVVAPAPAPAAAPVAEAAPPVEKAEQEKGKTEKAAKKPAKAAPEASAGAAEAKKKP